MKVTKLELDDYIVAGSDRSISETLTPIDAAAATRRTINGSLRSISNPAFRKFSVSLNGSDLRAPAFSGLFPGDVIEIGCITEFTQLRRKPMTPQAANATVQVVLARVPVSGSVTAKDISGNPVTVHSVSGKTVLISDRDADIYISYRPTLSCLVTGWNIDEDEAAASCSWSLSAEEI